MTFIVETGAGLEFANSYTSVEFADAYFDQYGVTDWAGEDDAKQLALIKATRSIDIMFGQEFQSYPTYPDVQALAFPRAQFYINTYQSIYSNSIPRLLKEATCELALQVLLDSEFDLYPDVVTPIAKKNFVKLDELEIDVEYASGQSVTNERLSGFYKIELLLKPLLSNGGEAGSYYAYASL